MCLFKPSTIWILSPFILSSSPLHSAIKKKKKKILLYSNSFKCLSYPKELCSGNFCCMIDYPPKFEAERNHYLLSPWFGRSVVWAGLSWAVFLLSAFSSLINLEVSCCSDENSISELSWLSHGASLLFFFFFPMWSLVLQLATPSRFVYMACSK